MMPSGRSSTNTLVFHHRSVVALNIIWQNLKTFQPVFVFYHSCVANWENPAFENKQTLRNLCFCNFPAESAAQGQQ